MEISGIEGLSPDEVRMRVNQGGKFVIFTWTLSFIVMTVRRPTAIVFVNPGESAALKSIPYTLISLFLGWWGIPWGFIYTPMSIIENLGGGRDVTGEVMATLGAGGGSPSREPVIANPSPSGTYGSADPGTAFGGQPGTMRPPAKLSDQLGVENEAKAALYMGLAGIVCFPVGWVAAIFGVRAIMKARAVNMSTPGTAVAGIVVGLFSTFCFGSTMVIGLLAPKDETRDTPPPVVVKKDDEAAPGEAEKEVLVQPSLGGARDEASGFRLKVTKTYEKQKPSAKAPFHEPGGDWTFFDLDGGDGIELTAGVEVKKSAEAFSFGKARLSVPSKKAGVAFTKLFDERFGGKAGKLVPHPGPLEMGVAVLGQNMVREHGGGFRSGRFGKWTATKLFPELEGRQGEVFFNYSLDDGLAEFSEKDSDYADDLAFVFGSAFTTGK